MKFMQYLWLSLGACLVQVVQAQPERFEVSELAGGVYLVSGPQGNTLAARDGEGVVLVNGVAAAYADPFVNEVLAQTGATRIDSLVLSNWHPEFTGLNERLGRQAIPIIAHENTRQWLGATIWEDGDHVVHAPVVAQALPSVVFDDQLALPWSSGTLLLKSASGAYTDGDLIAYFKEANVLYAGPVVRADRWTVIDRVSNGFVGAQIEAYDAIMELADDDTRIVPYTGKVLSKAEFAAMRDAYRELFEQLVILLRQSKGAQEVIAANPGDHFPQWSNKAEYLKTSFQSFYGHLRETEYVGVMP
ncbi:MAG TPA: hypothetical protein VNR18_12635 [Hyphomicrobiales bacterium]|nr:hypothetical protein [Hyphomicrobiales bacterium]